MESSSIPTALSRPTLSRLTTDNSMDTFTSIDSNSNSIVSPPLSPSIPPAHHEKNDTDNQSTNSVIDKLNPKSSTAARHELNLSSKLATLKSLQKQIALDHEALEGIRSKHSQGSTGKDGTKVYGAEEKEFNNSTAESIKGIMAKLAELSTTLKSLHSLPTPVLFPSPATKDNVAESPERT